MELGGWFRKIDDPILLEFLKVWGRIEVEGHNRTRQEFKKSLLGIIKRLTDEFMIT